MNFFIVLRKCFIRQKLLKRWISKLIRSTVLQHNALEISHTFVALLPVEKVSRIHLSHEKAKIWNQSAWCVSVKVFGDFPIYLLQTSRSLCFFLVFSMALIKHLKTFSRKRDHKEAKRLSSILCATQKKQKRS